MGAAFVRVGADEAVKLGVEKQKSPIASIPDKEFFVAAVVVEEAEEAVTVAPPTFPVCSFDGASLAPEGLSGLAIVAGLEVLIALNNSLRMLTDSDSLDAEISSLPEFFGAWSMRWLR